MKTLCLLVLAALLSLQACAQQKDAAEKALTTAGTGEEPLPDELVTELNEQTLKDKVVKTEQGWRKILTSEEYRALRNEGTEPPFANEYNKKQKKGYLRLYHLRQPLFSLSLCLKAAPRYLHEYIKNYGRISKKGKVNTIDKKGLVTFNVTNP